jgi:hypothetical protein
MTFNPDLRCEAGDGLGKAINDGVERRRRKRVRKTFNLNTARRREIERLIRYRDAGDTDDLSTHLVPWAAHNRDSKRPVEALMMTAARLGGHISAATAMEIVAAAQHMSDRMTADYLAKTLGVTYEERQRLGLTTIGSIDVDKEGRKERRKRRDREAHERRRRAQGAKPRSEYEANALSKAKPWLAAGISRRQWYRRRSTQRSQ